MEVINGLSSANVDWDEIFEYQPGFIVELKSHPGVFDTIQEYDPMMVPPVWLVNDPRPRYPYELRVLSKKNGNELFVATSYK
jgi:hypothetical protein